MGGKESQKLLSSSLKNSSWLTPLWKIIVSYTSFFYYNFNVRVKDECAYKTPFCFLFFFYHCNKMGFDWYRQLFSSSAEIISIGCREPLCASTHILNLCIFSPFCLFSWVTLVTHCHPLYPLTSFYIQTLGHLDCISLIFSICLILKLFFMWNFASSQSCLLFLLTQSH